MSLTYSTFNTSLANLLVVAITDPGYVTALPNIIDDAEQRLYRELDLVNTSTRDSTASLTAGNRNFTLPSTNGTFIVTDEVNIVTPAGTAPDSGTRVPLVPASEEMLNNLWPSVAGSTAPQYFAMINQDAIIVGPWPDQAYRVEVVGTIRPQPLSSTNTTTLLSVFFPDLMLAASMVFAAGYQRNFGAGSDDPKMATSWENHLQTLLGSAKTEEARKQFISQGWSAKQPAPLATPPRQ